MILSQETLIEKLESISFKPIILNITEGFNSVVGKISITERLKMQAGFVQQQSKAPIPSGDRKRISSQAPKMTQKPKIIRSLPDNPPNVSSDFTQKPSDFIETVQSLETGKKMFTCKFCGVQNSDKGNLGKHVLLKHLSNVPMIKCNLCDYESKMKNIMKRHYMGKHKLPENMASSALS